MLKSRDMHTNYTITPLLFNSKEISRIVDVKKIGEFEKMFSF